MLDFIWFSILFIIFDLEVTFLFPFGRLISRIWGLSGFFSMLLFLIILTVGFYYEWLKGALVLGMIALFGSELLFYKLKSVSMHYKEFNFQGFF
jgi:hypothetical protein